MVEKKLNQLRGRTVYVDLIRVVAIIGVIMLHASGRWLITSQELSQLNAVELVGWGVVDVYQSFAVLSVPLFFMLSGALLLQPRKSESLRVFFKKRWARIGLPFLFWTCVYFVWNFVVYNKPVIPEVITQGLLNGSYTHMWFMYVLIGLYLLTPILRVFVSHADQATTKYFIILWLIGASIIPVFDLVSIFQLQSNVFALTGYVGYFVLGTYLSTVKVRRSTLVILTSVGLALTALGTYVLAVSDAGAQMYFFQEYLSPTVALASVSLFLLLFTLQPPSNQNGAGSSIPSKLVKAISQNTLAIYLFHVIILESIQSGYFGFTLNRNTLNPIVEVPVMTVIVLFVSLAIILVLRQIPLVNRLIGCELNG